MEIVYFFFVIGNTITILCRMYGVAIVRMSGRVSNVVRFCGIPVIRQTMIQRSILNNVIPYWTVSIKSPSPQ